MSQKCTNKKISTYTKHLLHCFNNFYNFYIKFQIMVCAFSKSSCVLYGLFFLYESYMSSKYCYSSLATNLVNLFFKISNRVTTLLFMKNYLVLANLLKVFASCLLSSPLFWTFIIHVLLPLASWPGQMICFHV